MANKLKIRQIRSLINNKTNKKETIRALGLKRINDEVIHDDNPVIRGMVNTVINLVEFEEISGED